MKDSRFLGNQLPRGCANLSFFNFLAKNCMNMKEFGPRWGRASLVSRLYPSLQCHEQRQFLTVQLNSRPMRRIELYTNIYTVMRSMFEMLYWLPSATKLRRLRFYTCLSVILFTGGLPQCMLGYHSPGADTPPTPWDQVPPGPGTPRDQAPPGTRHPPGPGTLQDQAPPQHQAPPGRWLLLQTVRILLECILVFMGGYAS